MKTLRIQALPRQQSGFTLVEIAIVLVIIGLLLGGVLKGQELVNSAKVKNLANDFRTLSAFVYAYQDRFRAMPGDDRAAILHLGKDAKQAAPGTGGAIGNGRINGDWNSETVTDESFLFWQHIRLAGLATGTTTTVNTGSGSDPKDSASNAEYLPRNAESGRIGITSDPVLTAPTTPYPGSFYICSAGIQGRFAQQIDVTMDDGNPQTGIVRALKESGTDGKGMSSAKDADKIEAGSDDTAYFTVCMSF